MSQLNDGWIKHLRNASRQETKSRHSPRQPDLHHEGQQRIPGLVCGSCTNEIFVERSISSWQRCAPRDLKQLPDQGSEKTCGPATCNSSQPRSKNPTSYFGARPSATPAGRGNRTRPPSRALFDPHGNTTQTSPKQFTEDRRIHLKPQQPTVSIQPQTKTKSISQDQLIAEVKGIYAGLVMIEGKCLEVDTTQSRQESHDLNSDQWTALVSLHRTLLHKHHDFFLASQHPSASKALRRLASKYAMPARMWRHGIHSFLEVLRHKLPHSYQHMLAFIYTAYSMMALLHETVPAFKDTWIECLGDLARYRIAIEDVDVKDRETWTSVARHWYSCASEAPITGRLYHHLAILARPNAIQQLFYYTKSLCVSVPFPSARESIMTLFDPILRGTTSRLPQIDAAYARVHAILFSGKDAAQLEPSMEEYLGLLDSHIARAAKRFLEIGYNITTPLVCSLLGYGEPSRLMRRLLNSRECVEDTLDQVACLSTKAYSADARRWESRNALPCLHPLLILSSYSWLTSFDWLNEGSPNRGLVKLEVDDRNERNRARNSILDFSSQAWDICGRTIRGSLFRAILGALMLPTTSALPIDSNGTEKEKTGDTSPGPEGHIPSWLIPPFFLLMLIYVEGAGRWWNERRKWYIIAMALSHLSFPWLVEHEQIPPVLTACVFAFGLRPAYAYAMMDYEELQPSPMFYVFVGIGGFFINAVINGLSQSSSIPGLGSGSNTFSIYLLLSMTWSMIVCGRLHATYIARPRQ